MRLTSLLVPIKLSSRKVELFYPILREQSLFARRDWIENYRKVPLKSIRSSDVEVDKSFFGRFKLPSDLAAALRRLLCCDVLWLE